MFAPTQEHVRRFFCETWAKSQAGQVLTPMEIMAAHWVAEHPEYHEDLADVEVALSKQFTVEEGKTNPFLHLSMHLSITEQVSIDQPRGVKAAVQALSEKLGSAHEAQHVAMEALGEMVWASQRSGQPPDGLAYVDRLRQLASR